MQAAVCRIQDAVYRMQYAVYSMQYAVCSMQDAVYRMQYTGCSMQDAVYSMQYAVCSMQDAGCSMQDPNVLLQSVPLHPMSEQCVSWTLSHQTTNYLNIPTNPMQCSITLCGTKLDTRFSVCLAICFYVRNAHGCPLEI